MACEAGRQAHLICAGRKTLRDGGGEHTIIGSGIQSQEESKLGRVGGCRLGHRRQLLDNDVGVSNNLALRVQLLGRREVVALRVHEVPSLHVDDVHRDIKRSILADGVHIFWVGEFAGWHVGGRRDRAHGGGVARAARDLLAIRERLVGGGAEIDVVVLRRERGDLTSFLGSLPVLSKPGSDDRRVQCQRRLGVPA